MDNFAYVMDFHRNLLLRFCHTKKKERPNSVILEVFIVVREYKVFRTRSQSVSRSKFWRKAASRRSVFLLSAFSRK